jgi:hypothetical protein
MQLCIIFGTLAFLRRRDDEKMKEGLSLHKVIDPVLQERDFERYNVFHKFVRLQ